METDTPTQTSDLWVAFRSLQMLYWEMKISNDWLHIKMVSGSSSKKKKSLLSFFSASNLFILATYALWHPKAYRYYKTKLDKLWEGRPELGPRLFPRSIMPTAAFNLGDQVVTKKHIDSQNCPFGWCTITALGDFDASKGGHIVLWDLGVVLEFPAGACVCLPSALVTHSNIPTSAGEIRMSFTQYCAGEIFRYVENGLQTDKALEQGDPAIMLYQINFRETRIEEGYKMFSKVEDLAKNRARK